MCCCGDCWVCQDRADKRASAGAATGTSRRAREELYELSKQFKQAHESRCKHGAFDTASQQPGALQRRESASLSVS